jgi:hypothetical protein
VQGWPEPTCRPREQLLHSGRGGNDSRPRPTNRRGLALTFDGSLWPISNLKLRRLAAASNARRSPKVAAMSWASLQMNFIHLIAEHFDFALLAQRPQSVAMRVDPPTRARRSATPGVAGRVGRSTYAHRAGGENPCRAEPQARCAPRGARSVTREAMSWGRCGLEQKRGMGHANEKRCVEASLFTSLPVAASTSRGSLPVAGRRRRADVGTRPQATAMGTPPRADLRWTTTQQEVRIIRPAAPTRSPATAAAAIIPPPASLRSPATSTAVTIPPSAI